VQLLIRGQSNQEIARTFSIGEGAVKSHLKHICQKLECDNRVGLLSRIRQDIF
jgi:DNA-binding CsgD family transcriptional regulator